MKVKAIVINGNDTSETGFGRLVKSNSNVENSFKIERFDAIVPDQTDDLMKSLKLTWTWPWSGSKTDEKSGIRMHSYGGKNQKRRIACFLSHFLLWKEVHDTGEPILILEHDAEFLKRFDPKAALDSSYGAIGINDPRGATRRANVFYDIINVSKEEILPCPVIDRMEIALGLAGASAYLMKPSAAKKVIDVCYEYGAWPNDASLCQQLLPKELGVTKKLYTHVQGLSSTTTSLE